MPEALLAYELPPDASVTVLNVADGDVHPDLVVLVEAGSYRQVVRFVADQEWSWLGHQHYSDDMLREQLRFADHLVEQGLRFPARFRPPHTGTGTARVGHRY